MKIQTFSPIIFMVYVAGKYENFSTTTPKLSLISRLIELKEHFRKSSSSKKTLASDKSNKDLTKEKINPYMVESPYLDTFQRPQKLESDFSPFTKKLLLKLASIFGYDSIPIHAMRVTRELYQMCAKQMDDNREFYIEKCDLPDSFQTWFQITLLHVWILMVRCRSEVGGRVYIQQLVNHFFDDSDWRIRNIHDLLSQFKGAIMSYDEGMCKDDPVLAAALWRNILVTEGTAENIAYLVEYVRLELQKLDKYDFEEILQGHNSDKGEIMVFQYS
ncbi:3069_t:CDS:2 [Entrophospora sp. SA101]|nr:3069_t:CDS:2 [Entrophospora sp. SA101]